MWFNKLFLQKQTQYIVFVGLTNKCLESIMCASELIAKNEYIL